MGGDPVPTPLDALREWFEAYLKQEGLVIACNNTFEGICEYFSGHHLKAGAPSPKQRSESHSLRIAAKPLRV